jgi:hypothetical protein
MSILSRLFGGGSGGTSTSNAKAPTEEYKGFRITLTPIKEGDIYRVSALIEKDAEGETLRHELIRADTVQGLEAAQAASRQKAKQVIDEQGERIFARR